MTWKTNWRGDIDKVLDASNVLNIDHLFDEEGESHATQNGDINNTDNSIYITYMYTSEGKSIGKIKSTKKNTLAFISKSSNDDVDLLELRKNNYKALNQSNDPFKNLLKYGHFYDLKSIKDFYIDYNSYFIATKIDKYEIQYIKNLKLNDRPFQTNKLFAECISNLIEQNEIIRPSKSIPKSSEDLLSNFDLSGITIHIHPELNGKLTFLYKEEKELKTFNIYSTNGPSYRKYSDPSYILKDMELAADNGDRNGRWNAVVEKKSVWLYNQWHKIEFNKTIIK